jgi:acyl-CoA oxidase
MTDQDITSSTDDHPTGSGSFTDFLATPGSAWTAGQHAWLLDALPPTAFCWPDELARNDRLKLAYSRAASTGRAAPKPASLLADPSALCALLARAAVADPELFHILLVHYTLVLAPLLQSQHNDSYVELDTVREELESMTTFGTAVLTEGNRSNSHLHVRTRAAFDPASGNFVLHTPDTDAVKFPATAGHPTVPKTGAVYAQLTAHGRECGMFVFMVPLRGQDGTVTAGVHITPAPDTSALPCDYAAVRFDNVHLPFHAWLSDGASIDTMGRFEDTAASTSARLTRTMSIGGPHVWRGIIAASAAVAQASARILYSHTANRLTMGRLLPEAGLLRYRNQQQAVLDALANAYALAVIAQHTTTKVIDPTESLPSQGTWAPWSTVDQQLPLLKATATSLSLDTVAHCRTRSGARGFLADNRLNSYHGFVDAYRTAGGDNELILLDTAQAMMNPLTYQPPRLDACLDRTDDLLSPPTWLSLACTIERYCHDQLAAGLDAAKSDGAEEFTAWNDNLFLARSAASAWADRIVVELLCSAHRTAPRPVDQLFSLFALSWIEKSAQFLAALHPTPRELMNRIWAHRRELCDDLSQHSADLANAIGLPDQPAESMTCQAFRNALM